MQEMSKTAHSQTPENKFCVTYYIRTAELSERCLSNVKDIGVCSKSKRKLESHQQARIAC